MWAYETPAPARGPSRANHSCVLHAFLGELPLQDASHSFHIAIDGFRRSAYLPMGAAARRHACAHLQSGGGHVCKLQHGQPAIQSTATQAQHKSVASQRRLRTALRWQLVLLVSAARHATA